VRSLAELVFDYGFHQTTHNAVKESFLAWYYEASKSELVSDGLDADNSDLHQSAQEAQRDAENFQENHAVPKLVQFLEELEAKITTGFYYGALIAILFGGGLTAAGVLELQTLVWRVLFSSIGVLLGVSGVVVLVSYRVVSHQIKSNSELVAKFNQELVMKPGDVRSMDQDWHRLAAYVFWNRSLLSPSTHIGLIVLAVIRRLSPRLYGRIEANLREDIRRFVGMSGREIIRDQTEKVISEVLPNWQDGWNR